MTAIDERDERTVLARARAGLSPVGADQVRVRHAVAAILAGGAGAATGAVAAMSNVTGTTASSAATVGWPLKVLLASIGVAAVGGAGFGLGYRAGLREARPTISVATESAAPAPAPSPPATQASPPATQPLPPAAAPRAVAPANTAAAPVPDRRRPAKDRRAPAAAINLSPAESLAQEVRALRAVERALRSGQPSLALALLQQLEQAVPDGRLQEERQAMSAMARCLAGNVPFGVDLSRDFADAYPRSVYLPRVQQSCAAPTSGKDAQE